MFQPDKLRDHFTEVGRRTNVVYLGAQASHSKIIRVGGQLLYQSQPATGYGGFGTLPHVQDTPAIPLLYGRGGGYGAFIPAPETAVSI